MKEKLNELMQASLITHTSNLYHTMPSILLARSLVQHSLLDKVFFSNSGTEANEAALKFARKYARHHFLKNENGMQAFPLASLFYYHLTLAGRFQEDGVCGVHPRILRPIHGLCVCHPQVQVQGSLHAPHPWYYHHPFIFTPHVL